MIHAHDFVAAAPRRALPRRADAVPMTPWTYLALRRNAGGITQQQLADRLTALSRRERPLITIVGPVEQHMLRAVKTLETSGFTSRVPVLIDAIAAVMLFDADVYWQLARNAPQRHPRVCRGCGCSTHDACQHDHWGACAWVSPTQCSHCAKKAERAA